jgi:hypothetical protein
VTVMAGTETTPRAEIERQIRAKRRERELYVSAEGVARIHAELDVLLGEWEQASRTITQPAD